MSQETTRKDQGYAAIGAGFYDTYPSAGGFSLNLGYFLTPDSAVEFATTSVEAKEYKGFDEDNGDDSSLDFELRFHSLRYKRFFFAPFYVNIGLGYRVVQAAILDKQNAAALVHDLGTTSSIGVHSSLGSQWNFSNFFLGIDLGGVFMPVATWSDKDRYDARSRDARTVMFAFEHLARKSNIQAFNLFVGLEF
jgi:hypothetical protein